MNWEAIGAIGETIGALGVVLTLTYLSLQIRQNSQATRASTYSDTTQGWQDYLQTQSVQDLELLIKLTVNQEELSNAEFLRAYYLSRVMFRRMEHDYYQSMAGTFEEATWRAYLNSFLQDTFNNPALRAMWTLQKDYFDPKFSAFMSAEIAKIGRSPQGVRKRFAALLRAELAAQAP